MNVFVNNFAYINTLEMKYICQGEKCIYILYIQLLSFFNFDLYQKKKTHNLPDPKTKQLSELLDRGVLISNMLQTIDWWTLWKRSRNKCHFFCLLWYKLAFNIEYLQNSEHPKAACKRILALPFGILLTHAAKRQNCLLLRWENKLGPCICFVCLNFATYVAQ